MSALLARVCQALLQSIGFNPTRHLLFPGLHWLCRLQQSNPFGDEAQGPCAAIFDCRGVVLRTPLLFPAQCVHQQGSGTDSVAMAHLQATAFSIFCHSADVKLQAGGKI